MFIIWRNTCFSDGSLHVTCTEPTSKRSEDVTIDAAAQSWRNASPSDVTLTPRSPLMSHAHLAAFLPPAIASCTNWLTRLSSDAVSFLGFLTQPNVCECCFCISLCIHQKIKLLTYALSGYFIQIQTYIFTQGYFRVTRLADYIHPRVLLLQGFKSNETLKYKIHVVK